MRLVQYNPWSLVNQLLQPMERRLETEDSSNVETSHWMPLVDIKEEPNRFVLYADIPGVDPQHIEITMDNGVLTIRGERSSESKEEGKDYTRVERTKGVFYRRFSLPDTADPENISAEGKHGVLEIIIPKREKSQARKIEVKGSDGQKKIETEKKKK